MRRSSIIMLAAAAVLGIFSVLVALVMLRPASPTKSTSEAIVVASAPLSFGDKITADKLKLIQLPADAYPAGAYRSVNAAIADGKRVAQRAIALNEVIVPTAVSTIGNRLSAAGVIGPSMRAVSVNVTESSYVGGLIAPGDRVDVYVTHTPQAHAPHTEMAMSTQAIGALTALKTTGASAAPSATPAPRGGPHVRATPGLTVSQTDGGKPDPITDLLAQDVRVLALGQNTGTNSAKVELVKTATLEVTPEDAAKLLLGQQAGTISLALRGASDDERTALPSLRTQDLHDGPPVHTSAAPRARGPRHFSGPSAGSVEVIRAGAATSYSVPQ